MNNARHHVICDTCINVYLFVWRKFLRKIKTLLNSDKISISPFPSIPPSKRKWIEIDLTKSQSLKLWGSIKKILYMMKKIKKRRASSLSIFSDEGKINLWVEKKQTYSAMIIYTYYPVFRISFWFPWSWIIISNWDGNLHLGFLSIGTNKFLNSIFKKPRSFSSRMDSIFFIPHAYYFLQINLSVFMFSIDFWI